MDKMNVLYRAQDLKGNWVEGQFINGDDYRLITGKPRIDVISTGVDLIRIDASTLVMFTGAVDASESFKKIWGGSRVLFSFMHNTDPVEPGIVKWDDEMLQWVIIPDDSNVWADFGNPPLGRLVSWLKVLVVE